MDKQHPEITGKLTSSGSVYLIRLPKNKMNGWKYSNWKFEQPCLCLIFNSKKMKNKFSLAIMIAIGLVIVSCSTDTDGITTFSQKKIMSWIQKKQIVSQKYQQIHMLLMMVYCLP